ncbi:MAG: hypothetical protein NY202_02880 [Mollicutes bacterium UO1]
MAGKKITGRTKQLSLKSTPEFHQRLKVLASKEKCLMIEILEKSLELFEKDRKERKKIVNDSQYRKENPASQVSQGEVLQIRKDKRPFGEVPNQEEVITF